MARISGKESSRLKFVPHKAYSPIASTWASQFCFGTAALNYQRLFQCISLIDEILFCPVKNIPEMCAGACRRGLAVAVVSTYADDPLPPSPTSTSPPPPSPHRQGHPADLEMIHSVLSTLLQVHFYCLKEANMDFDMEKTKVILNIFLELVLWFYACLLLLYL